MIAPPGWHSPFESQQPVQLVGVHAFGLPVGQPKKRTEAATRKKPKNERMTTKQSLSTGRIPVLRGQDVGGGVAFASGDVC